jgi:hypothetical protein
MKLLSYILGMSYKALLYLEICPFLFFWMQLFVSLEAGTTF